MLFIGSIPSTLIERAPSRTVQAPVGLGQSQLDCLGQAAVCSQTYCGLSREALWQLLQEYRGANRWEVWEHWQQTQQNMNIYKAHTFPFCIDVAMATRSFEIDNEAARKALDSSKARHARRWQTKEGTYRVKQQYPPDVRDGRDVSMGDA